MRTLEPYHRHIFAGVLISFVIVLFGVLLHPRSVMTEDGAPGAPQSLAAQAVSQTEIDLTWELPESQGSSEITHYVISYLVGDEIEPQIVETALSDTLYRVGRLDPGTVYTFTVAAVNREGQGPYSDSVVVSTLSEDVITIEGSPSVEVSTTSATITWATSGESSSQVYYGITADEYDASTEVADDVRMVIEHTVALSSLLPCTTYWFKVVSENGGEPVESSQSRFSTSGCRGDARVTLYDAKRVTPSTGATLETKTADRGLEVVAPTAVKDGLTLTIQTQRFEKSIVEEVIAAPTGRTWIGDDAYSITVLADESTAFDEELDKSVDVSIDYTDADIVGFDPASLTIYHYEDGSGWMALSGCSNEYDAGSGAGTVTCMTSSFSIFGLFGAPPSAAPTSSRAPTTDVPVVVAPTPAPIAPMPIPVPAPVPDPAPKAAFTKDLLYGDTDAEVQALQTFLNAEGFPLAEEGAGAPGYETDYFGPRTRNALIRFQEAYKDVILAPLGLTRGTGFFGPNTRAFINGL